MACAWLCSSAAGDPVSERSACVVARAAPALHPAFGHLCAGARHRVVVGDRKRERKGASGGLAMGTAAHGAGGVANSAVLAGGHEHAHVPCGEKKRWSETSGEDEASLTWSQRDSEGYSKMRAPGVGCARRLLGRSAREVVEEGSHGEEPSDDEEGGSGLMYTLENVDMDEVQGLGFRVQGLENVDMDEVRLHRDARTRTRAHTYVHAACTPILSPTAAQRK